MRSRAVDYEIGGQTFEGYLASRDDGAARPGVMIAHAWSGPSEYEQDKARRIAELGYTAFVVDMYGKGKRGKSLEENRALMAPFLEDRALLRERVLGGLTAMRSFAEVDSNKIAAMGFCFGGMCVLDLARGGADIRGVISVHGMLHPPKDLANELIKAKVLTLHGYEDPMATPEQLTTFATEMTEAGVDWQVHAYGLTYHSFTNPAANDPSRGTVYNPVADSRSWVAIQNFLSEIFRDERSGHLRRET